MTKLEKHASNYGMGEKRRIALGLRPRTLRGWWFWLSYWSPIAWRQ